MRNFLWGSLALVGGYNPLHFEWADAVKNAKRRYRPWTSFVESSSILHCVCLRRRYLILHWFL